MKNPPSLARSVAQIRKKPPAPSLRTRAEARRGPRANATDDSAIVDQSTVRVPTGDRQEPKRGEQKQRALTRTVSESGVRSRNHRLRLCPGAGG